MMRAMVFRVVIFDRTVITGTFLAASLTLVMASSFASRDVVLVVGFFLAAVVAGRSMTWAP